MNSEIRDEALCSFERFFDNRRYVLGPGLERFETEYARFNQVQHCIGVANGLDALRLSLFALDIGPGDEVILPSHTFIATALAVSQVGARPVFVEPDRRTMNLDPDLVERAITPRTKAIIPVHLYGQACRMEELMFIADRRNIPVVEDNAQSQGAQHLGRPTGALGKINATSFYPGKNLGAFGDAGAITTNDEVLARKVRLLRNYGSEKKYQHEIAGVNSRLDELQATLLCLKLKHLPRWNAERVGIAKRYLEGLSGVGDLELPYCHPDSTHVYHLYVIRTKRRDDLQAFLSSHGIETLIHYPVPIHIQPAYAHMAFKRGAFPIAESIASTCLSLPLYPGMRDEQIEKVIENIQEFYD